MKEYKARYKSELITSNTIIQADGYSCISFENIGNSDAYLNENVPLYPASGISRFFNEKPWVEIDTDFLVSFDSEEGTDENKVIIIYTYYDKII